MATRYLLIGPWGTGKATRVPHLCCRLPEAVVFEWPLLLPGLSAAARKSATGLKSV